MNQLLPEIKLTVLAMNQVAAKISIGMMSVGHILHAECFEIGVDGSKPDWPLAIAHPDGILQIGTPFLWSAEAQPCYSVIVTAKQGGRMEQGEVQFGFDAAGKIVITRPLRAIDFCPSQPKRNWPSLFIVGDSTAYSNGPNQRGWGDELRNFFDARKLNVHNRARPGRSTRSFRNEGLWARVLAELKSGDVVLIQFGHNDADKLSEGRCRGVLPGLGEEIREVAMPGGGTEAVHTFGWYLRQFVVEAKARDTTVVLLSPTPKNLWSNGKLVRCRDDFGYWSAAVAAETNAAFVDLGKLIADRYDALGFEKVQTLFCSAKDNVHTSPAGARLNAECMAAGLEYLDLLSV